VITIVLARLDACAVRGTVRDVNDTKKTAHLKALIAAGRPLELVRANLTEAEGWAGVMQGCEWVAHVASPFVLGVKESEVEAQLIRPAVQGRMCNPTECGDTGSGPTHNHVSFHQAEHCISLPSPEVDFSLSRPFVPGTLTVLQAAAAAGIKASSQVVQSGSQEGSPSSWLLRPLWWWVAARGADEQCGGH
jgi:hypothetical protein